MLLALGMLLSTASLGQAYLSNLYVLMAVSKSEIVPGPNFYKEAQQGLRGYGSAVILSWLGIWAIKLNFLLFFKRLGAQITAYTISWWIVLFATIACGAASLGLMQYDCMFGPINDIINTCARHDSLKQTSSFFKGSCIVDVVSDVLSKSV